MLRFERSLGSTTKSGSYDGWNRYFRKRPNVFKAVVSGLVTSRYTCGSCGGVETGMGVSGRTS